jgi:cytochrome c-type biogenesis protein CcmI
MTLLLISILVALVAAAWVVYPLIFKRWVVIEDRVATDVVEGESRKRVALAALKDVEYDHAAGKLDEADYQDMRSVLEREALEALQLSATRSAAASADRPAIVHKCGFSNPGGSRFCAGCGLRLA